MLEFKHLDDHSIYGDWSQETQNQVLIHWHPNGTICTVFILGGFDYGGGIDVYKERMDAKEVSNIIDNCKDNYDLYNKLRKLVIKR